MAIKQVVSSEFFKLLDPSVHEAVRQAITRCQATAVVLFENVDLCSSHLGERTAMVVGPTCTYKTVADCEGHHLHDLPSMRQYPQVWCPAEELLTDAPQPWS